MPITVTITSQTGTFQGGSYQLTTNNIVSTFASLQVNSLTFGGATFISTASPVGSYGCLIDPPSNNLVVLTLKGITGDTGIPIGTNQPSVISFANPTIVNTVGLAAAGAIAGVVTLTFF